MLSLVTFLNVELRHFSKCNIETATMLQKIQRLGNLSNGYRHLEIFIHYQKW